MSLEQSINDLNTTLKQLLAQLPIVQGANAAVTVPVAEEKTTEKVATKVTEKKTKKVEAAPAEIVEPEETEEVAVDGEVLTDSDKDYTFDDIADLTMSVYKKIGKDGKTIIAPILAKYKAIKISELKPADYAGYVVELNKILEGK